MALAEILANATIDELGRAYGIAFAARRPRQDGEDDLASTLRQDADATYEDAATKLSLALTASFSKLDDDGYREVFAHFEAQAVSSAT